MSGDLVVIYLCYNRLEYVQMTFPRLLDECRRSSRFAHLYIYDDESTDGTSEFITGLPLEEFLNGRVTYERRPSRSSTKQITWTVERTDAPFIAKIDNDRLLPEGCLDAGMALMDQNPKVGFLGFEPPVEDKMPGLVPPLSLQSVRHTAGVGIFRTKVFHTAGPIESKGIFFGFTKYQHHAYRLCRWRACRINGLWATNLDMSSSYSRVTQYRKQKWIRGSRHRDHKSIFNLR